MGIEYNGEEVKVPVVGIIIGILVVVSLFLSVYIVPAGERGVLLTFGKPNMDAVGEGLHFKIPFVQTVKRYEVRTQKIETEADSVTKDLQGVMTKVALNFHVMPESTPTLYQEVGFAYRERIIDPAIQESVKAVMAKYEIEELTERRPAVRNDIKEFLSEKLSKYYIVVDDFNIVNFGWSEEFNNAIEEKLTAEQKKLKAERDLERILVEKEQKIAQAQAEAESLRLQKAEITPDLVKLRQIEVQKAAIDKWDGSLPQVTGGAIPFIDIRNDNRSI